MNISAECEGSAQGITQDERKYLCQLFDNLLVENLAVSDSYDAQTLNESRNQ